MPGRPQPPGGPEPGPLPPTRIWLDPDVGWQEKLYERLLEQRIVLASGILDESAATRLSAQLLTLDAEGDGPIRLELQNLQAELPAALTLMGVLDVVRAEVRAFVGGEIGGPALGVLASCPRRLAYPNASFTLSEPRLRLSGTADSVSAREQQVRRMMDSLIYRIAEATGRDADDIREDVGRGRVLTVAEAIGYGLIHNRAARRNLTAARRDPRRRPPRLELPDLARSCAYAQAKGPCMQDLPGRTAGIRLIADHFPRSAT